MWFHFGTYIRVSIFHLKIGFQKKLLFKIGKFGEDCMQKKRVKVNLFLLLTGSRKLNYYPFLVGRTKPVRKKSVGGDGAQSHPKEETQ
jgi:hypothetical protein